MQTKIEPRQTNPRKIVAIVSRNHDSPEAAGNKAQHEILNGFADTDAGNAEAFELLHGHRFRFDHTRGKWMVWNGRCWAVDEDNEADRAALQTVRARRVAMALIEDAEEAHERIRFALRSESVKARKALLESARSISSIKTTTAAYDLDPFLLTVGNGTLDLRSGKLRPARPQDLITRATSVPYDPSAKSPRWERFLDEIFNRSAHKIGYVQRAMGYSLTGDTREQCFFLLWGEGGNGKTVLTEIAFRLVGKHGQPAPFATFVAQWNRGAPRNDLAAMHGARFIKAVEGDKQAELDATVIKQVTGGDTISARFLYHEGFSYVPQFKIWLVTNHKPRIPEDTDAIWRRVRLIEFKEKFNGPRRDRTLTKKLEAELPGILAWAVRGCLDWQKNGLGEPPSVIEATQGYRRESDQLGRFLHEGCTAGPQHETSGERLYAAYRNWCTRVGEQPKANNSFASALAERGFRKKRMRKGVVYLGIKLGSADSHAAMGSLLPKFVRPGVKQ